MNFDKIFALCASVVMGFAAVGQIDTLQTWVYAMSLLFEAASGNTQSPWLIPESPILSGAIRGYFFFISATIDSISSARLSKLWFSQCPEDFPTPSLSHESVAIPFFKNAF